MRRADRLFRLVQVLRSRRHATGRDIAHELGVSTRTVYRDVADLQYSGVPIRGEAGVGYRLERGYELPPLTFTSEELEGLVLGARMVRTWADPELAGSVASAMTKIEAVVPEALRKVLLDTPLFAPDWVPTDVAREVATLRRAISQKRVLHFAYERADGARTERDARPLGLYFWGKAWTLAAWCELREDFRNFRPDRMRDVCLLDRQFETDDAISLAEFVRRMEASA